MAHDASQNNPKKEIACALVGAIGFLTIVLGIAVSGWLRPAGNHEVATVSATQKGKELEETLKAIETPKADGEAEKTPTTQEAPKAEENGAASSDNADTASDVKTEESSSETNASTSTAPEGESATK